MDIDRATSWLQIAANVGILGGLILVALQMNQNEELLRTQILHDTRQGTLDFTLSMMGEDPAVVLAKVAGTPDKLTESDKIVWRSLDANLGTQWYRLLEMSEAGLLEDEVWQNQISYDVGTYYNHPYGRNWLLEELKQDLPYPRKYYDFMYELLGESRPTN